MINIRLAILVSIVLFPVVCFANLESNLGPQAGIDYAHYENHKGNHYQVGHVFTAVANGTTVYIGVSVNNQEEIHAMALITTEGLATFNCFENPTYSGGTALTVYSNNRQAGKTIATSFVHTPTISTQGTQCTPQSSNGGSTGGNSAGGVFRGDSEVILNKNSKYLIAVTNLKGTAGSIGVHIALYND